MIYKCLWKGPDKVTRNSVINTLEQGGLNLTDITWLHTSACKYNLSALGTYFVSEGVNCTYFEVCLVTKETLFGLLLELVSTILVQLEPTLSLKG